MTATHTILLVGSELPEFLGNAEDPQCVARDDARLFVRPTSDGPEGREVVWI